MRGPGVAVPGKTARSSVPFVGWSGWDSTSACFFLMRFSARRTIWKYSSTSATIVLNLRSSDSKRSRTSKLLGWRRNGHMSTTRYRPVDSLDTSNFLRLTGMGGRILFFSSRGGLRNCLRAKRANLLDFLLASYALQSDFQPQEQSFARIASSGLSSTPAAGMKTPGRSTHQGIP